MGTTYNCDVCGKEFESLDTWSQEHEMNVPNLWVISAGYKGHPKEFTPMMLVELCADCKEKLEKIIKDGF